MSYDGMIMRYDPKLKSVDPRACHPGVTFAVESEAEALNRYHGFGAGLFRILWKRHPELRGRFVFLKDECSDDLWSFCNLDSSPFGIQLDPDIEVICLWNTDVGEEIGDWETDPVGAALESLEQTYIRQGT